MSTAIGVFIKVPRAGSVKTRLGRDIGEKAAASFYAGCVAWLIERLRASPFEIEIFYSPTSAKDRFFDLYPEFSSLNVTEQQGPNLGQRMYYALETLSSNYDSPLIIGSDAPLLPMEYLETAARALDETDLVLGPSRDGGYYLVGMTDPRKELFFDMEWSHPGVMDETLDRAGKLSLSVETLPEHNDFDTLSDLLEVTGRKGGPDEP